MMIHFTQPLNFKSSSQTSPQVHKVLGITTMEAQTCCQGIVAQYIQYIFSSLIEIPSHLVSDNMFVHPTIILCWCELTNRIFSNNFRASPGWRAEKHKLNLAEWAPNGRTHLPLTTRFVLDITSPKHSFVSVEGIYIIYIYNWIYVYKSFSFL